MKLKYYIKLEGIIERLRYLDLFDLGSDTILPLTSIELDTITKEFFLIPWCKEAKELDSIDEFTRRINFLYHPSIHNIPLGLDENEYKEIVCNPLVNKLGAISKNKLIPGSLYRGECRNSDIAIWLEEGKFEYIRYKFSFVYLEKINHYEDDDGYDVFVPLEKVENKKWLEKYEKIKKESNH